MAIHLLVYSPNSNINTMIRYILFILFAVSSLASITGQCVGQAGQVRWYYYGDLPNYDMDEMYADPGYPNGPDDTKILNSLASPFNYADHFGAVIKGFINVSTSGPVTFNVTGDDHTYFYLSTNTSADNLMQQAFVDGWTGRDEHDKYPSQTSTTINLNANQNYYFELHNREGGGGDHAHLYWKNNFVSQTVWTLITSQYLSDLCNDPCPKKGTPCNDGTNSTTNDVHDGICNCIGTPTTNNSCIGERGKVQVYFYDDINNGMLDDLYADPDYPQMPDRLVLNPDGLMADWGGYIENYGALIQGYIIVPETGSYSFNLTGIRNVKFKLSSDSSPSNIDTYVIETEYGTNPLDHDDNPLQTVGPINLLENTYYYFELHQAVNNWGHNFGVYWKGPQFEDDSWHRISADYLFDYDCEMACLPNGLACNDGDPNTANDQITSCDCTGTPCGENTGVACDDPSIVYETFDYCEATYELDNRFDDSWLSCEVNTNPYVASRSGFHWIHYDLGQVYKIHSTHVWNYNVLGQTNRGFRNVAVDYSFDGDTWFTLGNYVFPYASGNPGYPGITGPNFNGESARYVMITSLDNPSTCRGLSKVTFDVESCPARGTECDDGFNSTVHDHYTYDCECTGYTPLELNCQIDTLFITEAEMTPASFHAVKALMSNGEALTSSNVNYKAGLEVVLNSGFEVSSGAEFLADIEDCGGSTIMPLESEVNKEKRVKTKLRPAESLHIYSLESMETQTVHFYLPKASEVKLEILDHKGNLKSLVIIHDYQNFGDQYKRIQTKNLDAGIYLIRLTTESNVLTEKMTILK